MYSSIKLAALCSLLILEHYKCTHTHARTDAHTQTHTHARTHAHAHTHTHTQDGFFPLYSASSKGYDGIVEMLLQTGATVDLQQKVEDCYYRIAGKFGGH